jgi:hypothetical protein
MVLFGKYLLERGVLTRPQLVDATQAQVIFGGRLGTNLVDLGYLEIDELERHLGELLGIPVAPSEWLERPEPAALKKVSADLATRHGIFPLALEKQTLHLAMADPRNPDQIDDSAFATGLRIRPYVVSELRLAGLFERHYGIRRETRTIDVGPELRRGRHATKGREDAATPTSIGLATDEREGIVDPLAAGQELIDEAAFSALQDDWQNAQMGTAGASRPDGLRLPAPSAADPAPESTRTPGPPVVAHAVAERLRAEPDPRGAALSAVALEAALAKADDRDRVGRLALRLARLHACAAALFVVRGGMIAAFCGDGEAIEAELDGLLIPLEAETIFAAAATSGRPWRGRPPVTGTDGLLLRALGRRDLREALVLPITVHDRVINLLYADNAGDPLAVTAVAALSALSGCVSQAYERLILERKRRFT